MSWSKARCAGAVSLARRHLPLILSGFRCSMPAAVDIELTNRCNLRCPMCWFHGERGRDDQYGGAELSTQEVLRLIEQLSRYGTKLYLGGGEPFIRKDFLQILRHIKGHALPVVFATNGTSLDAQTTRELVDLQIDRVNFSIDGRRELHDSLRGNGVFDKVTDTIRSLSHYRKIRSATRPAVCVNITVTARSLHQIQDTIQAIRDATDSGVDVYRIHHLWFITETELAAHQTMVSRLLGVKAPGAASHVLTGRYVPDPFQLANEIQGVRCLPDVECFPDLDYSAIVKFYSHHASISKRCVAPLHGAVVKPNGDVRFCPDEWIDDYTLGNIQQEDFKAIWNNFKARRFRAVLFLKKQFTCCKRCSWMYSF
jgi:radical SAM protein with 4Fe4S-binding SPASM domain